MDPTWFLIIAWLVSPFALFRISRMIVFEDGPFDLFFRFRYWIGVYDLAENEEPKTGWGKLFACPLCTGVWICLFILLLLLLDWYWTNLFIIWMGLAGIQTYIHLRVDQ